MQQSLATPVVARPFVPVPKDDPRRTSGYVPKPAPVPPIFLDPQSPFNPPLPFPSGSPSPEPPSAPAAQVERALEHMNVSPEKLDLVTSFLNDKRATGAPLSEVEAAGLVKLIQDSVNGMSSLPVLKLQLIRRRGRQATRRNTQQELRHEPRSKRPNHAHPLL